MIAVPQSNTVEIRRFHSLAVLCNPGFYGNTSAFNIRKRQISSCDWRTFSLGLQRTRRFMNFDVLQ